MRLMFIFRQSVGCYHVGMNPDRDIDRAIDRRHLYLAAERAFGMEAVRKVRRSFAASKTASETASQDESLRNGLDGEIGDAPRPQVKRPPGKVAPPASGSGTLAPATVPVQTAPSQRVDRRGGAGSSEKSAKPIELPIAAPPQFDPLPDQLDRAEKLRLLELLDESYVRGCVRCRLARTRLHTVFGEGDADAAIFFIGEGPGGSEDETGRPFVGGSGKLLDGMITSMGLARERVYIANIVKCRAFLPGPPPKDRPPAPDEVQTCSPYLVRQLQIVRPRVIVTLGLSAAKYMLGGNRSMSELRGVWQRWQGIALMPTYHPAYVKRSYTPEVRGAVWSDLKQVMKEIGLPGA